MKRMKNLILLVIAFAIVFLAGRTSNGAESVDFYRKLSDKLNIIQTYDTDELDYETLTKRNGNIIIERTIGIVLDDKGNGKILNTKEKYYNYISYKNVDGAKTGDIILTYCIYNPDNNYEDDIIERFDYIIDTKQ